MQRLTFDGANDLYQTPYGAYTLDDYERIKKIRSEAPRVEPLPHSLFYSEQINISDELAARNERCIDEYGCSMF